MSDGGRRVKFNDDVQYFMIPGQDEDRLGTWVLDALRFKMRVLNFQKIFERDVVKKKKTSNLVCKTKTSNLNTGKIMTSYEMQRAL